MPDAKTTPSTTRRPHSKSRQGCADCRRRRVKCDEVRPRCRQCVRRDIPCVYPPAAAASKHASSPSGSSATAAGGTPRGLASASSPSIASAELSAGTFTTDELARLHRWTVSTSRAIVSDHPTLLPTWQVVFPEIGFRHPFVLHGLFSLVSLHQAHLDPHDRKRLTAEAARSHNHLIQGFRAAVAENMEQNCDALLTFVSINIVYVFASYGWIYSGDDGDAARKSRILGAEWLPMVRGTHAVLYSIYGRLREGPLSALTDLEPWESIDPDRDTFAEDTKVRALSSIWAACKEKETYERALLLLRRCYAYMTKFQAPNGSSDSRYFYSAVSGPMIWILMAPAEYFTLLEQRQPSALIIFAYVGALFHRLNHLWFYKGWGRSIVTVVGELLGEYWLPWMSGPKEWTASTTSSA